MRPGLLLIAAATFGSLAVHAQTPAPPDVQPQRVDVVPAAPDALVGETLTFSATAFDSAGGRLDATPSAWFVSPFDSAGVGQDGKATFFMPGIVTVGALINGKTGFATIRVKRRAPATVQIEPLRVPARVGDRIALRARATMASGDPLTDVEWAWQSDAPAVVSVDGAGVITGLSAGTAVVRATADGVTGSIPVRVVTGSVQRITVTPVSTSVRTGDAVRFSATTAGSGSPAPIVRWSTSGEGASIDAAGVFVAEQPGNYVVTASSGDRAAVASVVVRQRSVQRALEVVGRAPVEEFQVLEQWIVGNHAYVTSALAGRLWVYDISNPAEPVKVDSLAFDARIINDVSTSSDGRVAVLTREGASNRKNGLVFLDTTDPAHPRVASEYTETITGGVHSAFIDGHYVYATDNATGSLRVIDFSDVKAPREVGRWAPDRDVQMFKVPDGDEIVGGLMLHDVQVKDGLLYAAWWRDGLIVLDVGNGIKGGSPEKPAFVSQLHFNYYELYGPGWLAGAHAVFRHRNYVFVGDEVFPARYSIASRDRIPVKGIVHVVDVSDLQRPHVVATYEVPEGGSHNMWVEDDVMYLGYYNAGARVVDVSGELHGELYRQGREIARLWTGDPKGWRPNLPFCWGAQPHKGLIYFNDINSGIWITRLSPAPEAPRKTSP